MAFEDLQHLRAQAEELALSGEQGAEALRLNLAIIALDPDDLAAHRRLARIYANKGDDEEAARHWMEVLRIDPTDRAGMNATRASRELKVQLENLDTAPAHVVLQPCGGDEAQANFEKTVRQPVSLKILKEHLSGPLFEPIRQAVGDGEGVQTWAVVEGLRGQGEREWHSIESGDIAVFIRKREVFFSAKVLCKIRNAELGRRLWKPRVSKRPGETPVEQDYEFIYFLVDGEERTFPLRPLAQSLKGRTSDIVMKVETRPLTPRALEILSEETNLIAKGRF